MGFLATLRAPWWESDAAWTWSGIVLLGTALALAATIFVQRSLIRVIAELERANRELDEKNGDLADRTVTLEAHARHLHATSGALETANRELTLRSSRLEELSRRLEESNTELTRVNRMLLARTAEAEEANRTKRDFLAVMSHELRTPLNAIAGYAEILQMGLHGPVTDAQMAALDRIRRNQEYLLALITDVLNFAKEESGRIEVRMADVSVAELIRNVQERIEPQVMAKGLRYGYEIPDPAVRVRGDRQRIEQILLNLVGNAIKFTERGGLVRLGCEADGDRVRLRVTDTGCGIAPAQMRRIFEPFVRAHDGSSGDEGGAGLGLAISRQLARQMGGDLMAESVVGKGSTFTLELIRGFRVSDTSLFPNEMTIFGSEPPRTGGSTYRSDARSDATAAG
jgi:signal transduction histidine kinase